MTKNSTRQYEKTIFSLLGHLEYKRKLKDFIENGYIKYIQFPQEFKLLEVITDFYFRVGRPPEIDELDNELKDLPEVMEVRRHSFNVANDFEVQYDYVIMELKEMFIERAFDDLKNCKTLKELRNGMDKLERITNPFDTGKKTKIGEDYMEKAEALIIDIKIRPMKTGYTHFDTMTKGGIRKGYYYLFAGRTGSGKTRFSMCYARGLVKNGAAVLFFSFEMTKEDIQDMYMGQELGLDMDNVRAGQLEEAKIIEHFKTMAERDDSFHIVEKIDSKNPPTVEYIEREIQEHLKNGESLDVIIIDYIQIMADKAYKPSERVTMFGAITNGLRDLAVKYNIAVLVIAQMNRTGEKNEPFDTKQIAGSDLISHPCHFIAGIIRTKDVNEIKLEICKNRKGSSFDIIKNTMDWNTNTLTELGSKEGAESNYYEPKSDDNPF